MQMLYLKLLTIAKNRWKDNIMEEKKIEQLYKLLERSEKEKDAESVAALRWAIFALEQAAG